MRIKEQERLEELLWEMVRRIFYSNPGLPIDWLDNRLTDLADIFRPIKKPPKRKIPSKVKPKNKRK